VADLADAVAQVHRRQLAPQEPDGRGHVRKTGEMIRDLRGDYASVLLANHGSVLQPKTWRAPSGEPGNWKKHC
jgi:hypothetical protein